VVSGSHPRVGVRFAYADESDRVTFPFGSDTRIEGGRASGGDMHAVVVDKSHCRLYETWSTQERGGWYFQGEQNAAWPDRLVSDLRRIPARAFVAVDTESLRNSSASARVR
jgi:hypothetical protein